jgi:hypothetical protein
MFARIGRCACIAPWRESTLTTGEAMYRCVKDLARTLGALAVAAAAACGSDKSTGPDNTPATVTANVTTPASAVVGSPVNPTPSVVVKNASGTPLANVRVTFVVTAGGGTVAGASKLTDASGVAEVDSWTLGSAAGTQTLTANAGGKSVAFTLNATNTCTIAGAVASGGTVNGNLTTATCPGGDGTAAQSWTLDQATGQAMLSIEMHATGVPTFDAVLLLHRNTFAGRDNFIAFNDDNEVVTTQTTDSRLDIILGPGNYVLSANNYEPGVTGAFSIGVQPWDGVTVGCEDVFVTTGITATLNLTDRCHYTSGPNVRPFVIYLTQGQQVRFDLSSTAFDPKLDLYQLGGAAPVAQDDHSGGGTSARITYTAPETGFYNILSTAATVQTGAFTLVVTSIAGGPVAPLARAPSANIVPRVGAFDKGGRSTSAPWRPR